MKTYNNYHLLEVVNLKDCVIIAMFSKNETPYVHYYVESLKKNNRSYDIVYFDRYLNQVKSNENEFVFSGYCPTGGSKLKKIGIMLKYAIYINRFVSRKNYKKVIVLTTVPGIMLYRSLIHSFSGKYVLDIRDYTYEHIKLYKSMEKRLIDNSYSTIISSSGFKDFLPDSEKYVITHNIATDYKRNIEMQRVATGSKIRIGFVGSIRYFEENRSLIDAFSNDEKYQFDYYGTITNGCDLEGYVNNHGVTNVFFHGPFDNEDKHTIYQGIDVINSIYGIRGLETKTAVPNRFYDSAIYKKPIIVSKGTYLSNLVEYYNLGIAVDVKNEDVFKRIDDYLSNLDWDAFQDGCNRLLADVDSDIIRYQKTIGDFAILEKEDVL